VSHHTQLHLFFQIPFTSLAICGSQIFVAFVSYASFFVLKCCIFLQRSKMLLAQINRDSQGMAEFPGGGMEAQHVTLCLTEAVTVAGEQSS
jgi:hypothetical protein